MATAFKDLGIAADTEGFTGSKIPIDRLFNLEIVIIKYKIVVSNYKDKGNGKRLDMQIKLSDNTHVTWTGSGALMNTIQKIEESRFPIRTTIIKDTAGKFQFT